MKKIGIIVAMDKEFAQLRSLLEKSRSESHNFKEFVIGSIGSVEVVMQQCGIGKVNSAIGAVEMIDNYHPDVVISTGCAGGADVSLNPLDVVVATECAYHDAYCGENNAFGQIQGMPPRFKAPADLVRKALSLNEEERGKGEEERVKSREERVKSREERDLSQDIQECNHKAQSSNLKPQIRIVSGLTVSGDWFVDSREKMQSILDHFPEAAAVDMESCSIAQVCHVYHTPFVSFRVISDVPLKDSKASQYFDFWDKAAEGSFEVTKKFLSLL